MSKPEWKYALAITALGFVALSSGVAKASSDQDASQSVSSEVNQFPAGSFQIAMADDDDRSSRQRPRGDNRGERQRSGERQQNLRRDRTERSRGDRGERRANRDDRGERRAYREGRRDQRQVERRRDDRSERRAYRDGRQDQRRAYRDDRSDRRAYREGRRDQRKYDRYRERKAYERRAYRDRHYKYKGSYKGGSYSHRYGPPRRHGYYNARIKAFHYYDGYSPVGWFFVDFGYNLYSRSYLRDCEVVSRGRRRSRYVEVALLCYDDWGFPYIRHGSVRNYYYR